ncbi:MAG: 3-hydroxyacyl-CoA dehydrogenase NAD-binding domain-containing protein [Mariprofundaceae bacterium]
MSRITLIREAEVVRIHFERKDKSVNVLDLPCFDELEAHLDTLEREPAEVLILESGMVGCFIAGADLDLIHAAANADEAEALAERGQAICRRIEDLEALSIAWVHGSCMGGGLELALACNHIVAVHDGKTRLALPEIKIGIHPGFGGCVRLPKRVGWPQAIKMILSGSSVDAKRAKRIGLASLACHPEQKQRAIEYLRAAKTRTDRTPPLWLRLPPFKGIFFHQVHKKTQARFAHLDLNESYPAIPAVINLLKELTTLDDGLAYAREAESLGKCAITPTCKNLIRVFRLGETLKKQETVKKGKVNINDIDHAAVYGAGVMGSGISWVAAKDCQVDMHEIADTALSRGMKTLSQLARRDKERLRRIRPVVDASGLNKIDVVIEAVVENMDVKHELLRDLEAKTSKETLLLSNTSSLSVTEMQSVLKVPGRMAGMHFFNPAPKMPLVEVIAGKKSTKKTIQSVAALATRWGKFPIIVADVPGFLVNRCLMPYMAAALQLLEQGQKAEHVDGALKVFGMPMGALELADRVGLDICYHVGAQLETAYGDGFSMPIWFNALINDGLLGEKSGRGFFCYEKGKQKKLNEKLADYLPNQQLREIEFDANITDDSREVMPNCEIIDACLLPMLIESLKCLDQKVVEHAEHLDAAMIYGIGFPPFRGGLLHYYASQDRHTLVEKMKDYDLQPPENWESLLYA